MALSRQKDRKSPVYSSYIIPYTVQSKLPQNRATEHHEHTWIQARMHFIPVAKKKQTLQEKCKEEQEVKILLKQQHQTTNPTNRPHSDNAHSIVVRTMHCHCNRSFNRHIEPLQPGSAH